MFRMKRHLCARIKNNIMHHRYSQNVSP